MAKDFKNINTGRVYDTIAEATQEAQEEQTVQEANELPHVEHKPRRVYTDKEAAEAMAAMRTSGRKGCKLPRINMAFTPDNYDYIRVMARVRGESLTEFLNNVVEESIRQNLDVYKKAIEFKNSL